MKPDKLAVHDIFQKERRYVVPLYQRAYVWSEEEQWEPLWNDIERQAEACLAAPDGVAPRSHFLGAVVLNVAKIVGAGVACSEVIDGQQRLTTLQLFIAALRDFAVAHGSAHAAKLKRLTAHEDEPPGSEGSFKVWPTNADRDCFRSVMMAGSPQAVLKAFGGKPAGLPRIAAAYFYFAGQIAAFANASVAGNPDALAASRDQRILALVQALRTALQLIVIELEGNDDPQVIFETLNARGQALLPSDLIRNYVFLQVANDAALDANALYDSYWRPFDDLRLAEVLDGEDRFWHVEERQGRLTRPRIDLFMFHYLVMKTEREFNIRDLYREFRNWRDAKPTSTLDFLADLKLYSRIFANLVAPSGTDRLARFAIRLKALDNSTIYPLLLMLLALPQEQLSLAGRDQILDDLESWLVRRFTCGSTNKNYNRFFAGLLGRLKQAGSAADLPQLVRAELSRSVEPTLNWPSDEEFRHAWLNNPVYVRSRSDRSAMLLRAIEDHTRSKKNEAVTLPDKLTVEHLLPQKGSLIDYPYAEPMPLKDGEAPERCRSRLMHTIGNLTLLTRELNTAVSNGPFPAKVKQIVADSDLRLNAWLRDEPPARWSEASITARADDLFNAAKAIWARPIGVPNAAVLVPIVYPSAPTKPDLSSPAQGEVLWREDVRSALMARGGRAPLWAIYAEVEAIRRAGGRSVPASLDATVRKALEEACSESDNWRGKFDLFYMPEGKGAGIWALREFVPQWPEDGASTA